MLKKIKIKIENRYKYRIELHAHTSPTSICSDVSPEDMVKIYHKENYDAIVITNHFLKKQSDVISKSEFLDWYLDDYKKTKEEAKKYNINVLLGAEIRFTENSNDYLIFGVDREILSVCYDYLDKGIEVFRKEVCLDKSVFVQAHPFRNGMIITEPELLDGYEIFNMHPNHNSRNAVATRFALESSAEIYTVGSDFHHKDCGHEGVSALRVASLPETSFELAQILKSGDYVFEIGKNTIVIP